MLKIKAKCSQFILFLSLFQMNCIMFTVSDLDPDGLLSQLLLLSRLQNSSLATEPILTRSLYGYANGTKAFFQWHKVPDATSYKLYYSTSETVSLSDSSSPETTEPWILLDGLDTSTLYYFQLYATLSDGNQVTHKQSYPAFTNPVPFGTSSTVSAVNISAGQGLESGKYGVLNVNPYINKIHVSTQNGDTTPRIPSLFNCNPDGSNCSFQNLTTGNAGQQEQVRSHSTIDFESEKILYVSRDVGTLSQPVLFACPLDGGNCSFQNISAGQGNSSGQIPYVIINPLSGDILTLTRNTFLSTNGTLSLFRCDSEGANCQHKDISGPDRYLSTFERSSSFISPYNGKLYTVIPDHPSGKPSLHISDLNGENATSFDISATNTNGSSGDIPNLMLDHINSKLLVIANGFNTRLSSYRCDLNGSNCVFYALSMNNQGASPSAVLDLINNKVLIYTENADPGLGNARLLLFRCNLDGSSCESSVDISAAASLADNSGYRPTARIEPRTGKILISTENFSATPASIPYLFIH